MILVDALTPRSDITESQLITSQGLSLSASRMQIINLPDITNFPALDWFFLNLGGTTNVISDREISANRIGQPRTFEIGFLCFAPPNLSFTNFTPQYEWASVLFGGTFGARLEIREGGELFMKHSTTGDVNTGFAVESNTLYHVVIRCIGQTDHDTDDGFLSVWINGVEVFRSEDYMWSGITDSRAHLEDGIHNVALSGPRSTHGFHFRDIVMFEGLSTDDRNTRPEFFRVDHAILTSVNAETTYTDASVDRLTDFTDSTFASGANADDVLSLDFSTEDTLGTQLVAAKVWLDKTKITFDNADIEVNVSLQDGSATEQVTFRETTTNSFNDQYINFDFNGSPVNDSGLNLKIINRNVIT